MFSILTWRMYRNYTGYILQKLEVSNMALYSTNETNLNTNWLNLDRENSNAGAQRGYIFSEQVQSWTKYFRHTLDVM